VSPSSKEIRSPTNKSVADKKRSLQQLRINQRLLKIQKSMAELREVAHNIMETYMYPESSKSLNIPHSVRSKTIKKFNEWGVNGGVVYTPFTSASTADTPKATTSSSLAYHRTGGVGGGGSATPKKGPTELGERLEDIRKHDFLDESAEKNCSSGWSDSSALGSPLANTAAPASAVTTVGTAGTVPSATRNDGIGFLDSGEIQSPEGSSKRAKRRSHKEMAELGIDVPRPGTINLEGIIERTNSFNLSQSPVNCDPQQQQRPRQRQGQDGVNPTASEVTAVPSGGSLTVARDENENHDSKSPPLAAAQGTSSSVAGVRTPRDTDPDDTTPAGSPAHRNKRGFSDAAELLSVTREFAFSTDTLGATVEKEMSLQQQRFAEMQYAQSIAHHNQLTSAAAAAATAGTAGTAGTVAVGTADDSSDEAMPLTATVSGSSRMEGLGTSTASAKVNAGGLLGPVKLGQSNMMAGFSESFDVRGMQKPKHGLAMGGSSSYYSSMVSSTMRSSIDENSNEISIISPQSTGTVDKMFFGAADAGDRARSPVLGGGAAEGSDNVPPKPLSTGAADGGGGGGDVGGGTHVGDINTGEVHHNAETRAGRPLHMAHQHQHHQHHQHGLTQLHKDFVPQPQVASLPDDELLFLIDSLDMSYTQLFQEAKLEMLKMLRTDSFPRWKRTKEFRLFIEKIKPYNEKDSDSDKTRMSFAEHM
jgi:hypothetical protein